MCDFLSLNLQGLRISTTATIESRTFFRVVLESSWFSSLLMQSSNVILTSVKRYNGSAKVCSVFGQVDRLIK